MHLCICACFSISSYCQVIRPTLKYWVDLAQLNKSHEVILAETDNNQDTSVMKTTWSASSNEQPANKEVRLYTLKGSGHVMPSKVVDFAGILGGNAQDIDGADEVWAFFQSIQSTPLTQ